MYPTFRVDQRSSAKMMPDHCADDWQQKCRDCTTDYFLKLSLDNCAPAERLESYVVCSTTFVSRGVAASLGTRARCTTRKKERKALGECVLDECRNGGLEESRN